MRTKRRTTAIVLIMNGRESLIIGAIVVAGWNTTGADEKGVERKIERSSLWSNGITRKSEEGGRRQGEREPWTEIRKYPPPHCVKAFVGSAMDTKNRRGSAGGAKTNEPGS